MYGRRWRKSSSTSTTKDQFSRTTILLRKLFNIPSKSSDFSFDDDPISENGSDLDEVEDGTADMDNNEEVLRNQSLGPSLGNTTYMLTRRKSETLRVQYIDTKDIRIGVRTWNVGGRLPPDNLDIGEWLSVDEPADIYVIGFQEIVPLNAGNVLGTEDNRPVQKWESIIRRTLNRIPSEKFKAHSNPPSPSRVKPSDDVLTVEDEIFLSTDYTTHYEETTGNNIPIFSQEYEGEVSVGIQAPDTEENTDVGSSSLHESRSELQTLKRMGRSRRLSWVSSSAGIDPESSNTGPSAQFERQFSGTEKVGLSWPEVPLHLVKRLLLEYSDSSKGSNSFNLSRFGGSADLPQRDVQETCLTGSQSNNRSVYVRIVSKQMVGIFLTVWVRKELRRFITNLQVSTVGVGVMGYLGNKGSVSVSMSVYQTPFCFVCCHLTSGEKDSDQLKRNSDVQDVMRKTIFEPVSNIGCPATILDHEKIILFGDLNYRINLCYEKNRQYVLNQEWSKLMERDQLLEELREGHTFGGWKEAHLDFPPTYKYEFDTHEYTSGDIKSGRRNPAWCDRVLSLGKGIQQLSYKRFEYTLSDHRPVIATFIAEVEVFSHKKLQRALTFTDAELEENKLLVKSDPRSGLSHRHVNFKMAK